jgi:uncharacterized protein YbgA (DUF1722 family)
MVQPSTGLDLTSRMRRFSARFHDALGPVDGFLLKGKSPSCGIGRTKIHAPHGDRVLRRGHGLFAESVLRRHPHLAVEDEAGLLDFAARDRFLTRVFASARLRAVRSSAALLRFHEAHEGLLLGHDRAGTRALGRIAAEARGRGFRDSRRRYGERLARLLAKAARGAPRARAFEHAFGILAPRLSAAERRRFAGLLARYRASRAPVGAVSAWLRSWAERLGEARVAGQALLEPYPSALASLG